MYRFPTQCGGGGACPNPSTIKNLLRFRTPGTLFEKKTIEKTVVKKIISPKKMPSPHSPLSEHSPKSSCNNNPTITVQCEIPPTQQINTQCKQCLCTHGPVYEGLRSRSLSLGIVNIHTIIIKEHNDCSYIALTSLLYDD